MKTTFLPRLVVVALATLAAMGAASLSATALATSPLPTTAETAPAATDPDAAAVATAFLEARAAAVTTADPQAALSHWAAPDGGVVAAEALVARGTARRARQLHHAVQDVACAVEILGVQVDDDETAATVTAHAIVTTTWRAPSGELDTEASGIDHTLRLERTGAGWRVSSDTYTDVMRPSYLEAAGASKAAVRRAGRSLERSAPTLRLPPVTRSAAAASTRRYQDIIKYDRPGAQAFADKWAVSANPTYVRFSADCANFASQCARAGDMPLSSGGWDNGWWYDKRGTSSPGDDRYSLSWINVTKMISFWNGRRTDWAKSAGVLSRGDFIYYDWTGDGFWDHVAVVAGTNSAGQKVIDAHSTNYYRVFWKLGSSSTRYRYAKVRPQWVI